MNDLNLKYKYKINTVLSIVSLFLGNPVQFIKEKNSRSELSGEINFLSDKRERENRKCGKEGGGGGGLRKNMRGEI